MSSPSAMETLRGLSQTLWTIRANQEAAKILRTTTSLLRCFLFFDICYLVAGICLITMGLMDNNSYKGGIIIFGGLFGVFASLSALCNSLASHGVRTWKRVFLLPWLLFYLMILVLLTMMLAHSLYTNRLHWKHVFIVFATVAVFTSWKHMQRQFILMSLPRPQQVVVDIEGVVRDYLVPSSGPAPGTDLPPKYEDVEEKPPKYEASMAQVIEASLAQEAPVVEITQEEVAEATTAEGAVGGEVVLMPGAVDLTNQKQ